MSVNDRVREYRRRMKEQGFREIRVWVPDTGTPEFANAAHEQSLAAAEWDRAHPEVQDWIDAINDENEIWDDR